MSCVLPAVERFFMRFRGPQALKDTYEKPEGAACFWLTGNPTKDFWPERPSGERNLARRTPKDSSIQIPAKRRRCEEKKLRHA